MGDRNGPPNPVCRDFHDAAPPLALPLSSETRSLNLKERRMRCPGRAADQTAGGEAVKVITMTELEDRLTPPTGPSDLYDSAVGPDGPISFPAAAVAPYGLRPDDRLRLCETRPRGAASRRRSVRGLEVGQVAVRTG